MASTAEQRFVRAPEQPQIVDMALADGVFVKGMLFPRAGSYIDQHRHSYDHVSLVVGGARVWTRVADEIYGGVTRPVWKLLGEFYGMKAVTIKAGVDHRFMTMQDDTVIACIHNASRTGEIEIERENALPGVA